MNLDSIVGNDPEIKPLKNSKLTDTVNNFLNEKSFHFTEGIACGLLERNTNIGYFTMIPSLVLGVRCLNLKPKHFINYLCFGAGVSVAYTDEIYNVLKNSNSDF